MKVLVADDDGDLRDLIAFTLSQSGYLVLKAGDGPSAVRRFEEESPDLVVLDINMPGLSGFQVCEAIRKRSRIPVMMLTVRGEEEDLVRALGLSGADTAFNLPGALPPLPARARSLPRVETEALARRADLQMARIEGDAHGPRLAARSSPSSFPHTTKSVHCAISCRASHRRWRCTRGS